MVRSIVIAALAAVSVGLTLVPTDASARPGGGHRGGFHSGGFHAGGFHGGFRGGFAHSPGVRFGGHGFHHFGHRFAFVGLPLGGYWGYSSYADDCLVPRRVWTPYGWRVRWVNACYAYY